MFGERVREVNTVGHYTSRPIRIADLPKLDAKTMVDYYTARFANAADFTFFFVGSFKVDDVAPLIATYLGPLPSKGAADSQHRDLRLQFPTSVVREVVRKGQEPRASTVITFFSDTGLDESESDRPNPRPKCFRRVCATFSARSSAAPTRWASTIRTRRRSPATA